MRLSISFLLGFALLALVSVNGQSGGGVKLEAGRMYRLVKDAAIIPKHPSDYGKKAHEADFGTIGNARTLKAGSGIRVVRVRETASSLWYLVEVPDANAFSPPVRNASGWINDVDLAGAPPEPVVISESGSGKHLPSETRFMLIHLGAAMRVCEARAEAEPARRGQWLGWLEDSRRERERVVRESGIDPAVLESMLRGTSVEDYAYWAASRQIPADPAIKPSSSFSKPISGSTMVNRYPSQEPPPAPPAGGGRAETSMQPRRR